ncbi:hypothetical protein ACHQM5_027067 [Ranunculus cassubicifolius]
MLHKEEEEDEGCSSSCNSKDYNPCPICLGPITQLQEAYLDRCFHKFCYSCIERWSKHVARHQSQVQSTLKCPLCKRDNFSIVYECVGESFQRHYINKDHVESSFYTKDHKFRLRCYYREPGKIIEKFNVERFWKLRRYLQPNKYLQIWLKREIQALTQEEDVDIVVHHLLGLIDSFVKQNVQGTLQRSIDKIREDFKAMICDAARPFLVGRTERFVNEIELFLASGLTIAAYDQVYSECLEMVAPSAVCKDEEEERLYVENTQIPYLYFLDDDSELE